MAFRTKKISQMDPKGSNLASTDLLEISELVSGSYVTKSITGAEIIASVPPTTVDWGDIGGTLSSQTDLNTALSGKVPTTRTLTINGTTQDLSADRTFTVSTGITIGTTAITSGTVGRVLFEGTGNVVQESANLFWDNTNAKLLINGGFIIGADFVATSSAFKISGTDATIGIRSTSSSGFCGMNMYDNANNNIGSFQIGGTATGSPFAGNMFLGARQASGKLIFVRGVSATESMTLFSTGNFAINTTTDAGYKLDVNGTARVKTTDSSTPLNVLHSGSVGIQVEANANGYRLRLASSSTVASINTPDSYLSINSGGQLVVIGSTSTYNSAQLAVDSTTKGFLCPRMTTTQKNAIASPATGLMVYDTTLNLISVYNGTTWITL